MPTLSEDVKAFIVQSLACYETPAQVAEAVKAEFGVTIPRQQCELYDPGKHAGQKLSRKWRVLFDEARAEFKKGAIFVPIADRLVRLRMLQRHAVSADLRGNSVLMAALLEQAAKEVGDQYVNRAAKVDDPQDALPTQVILEVRDARKRPDPDAEPQQAAG